MHHSLSTNGQVEKCNRTLMDAVQCSVDKAQNCRDDHLAQIARTLRSAMNRNIGQRGGTFSHQQRQEDPGESPEEPSRLPGEQGHSREGAGYRRPSFRGTRGVLVPHTLL